MIVMSIFTRRDSDVFLRQIKKQKWSWLTSLYFVLFCCTNRNNLIHIKLNKFYGKNPKKIIQTSQPTAVEVNLPKKKVEHVDVAMSKKNHNGKTKSYKFKNR